jgi:hypothetical protein
MTQKDINKISVMFITVKHNLYYNENKLQATCFDPVGSSSGQYGVLKLLVHENNILPDGIPSGLYTHERRLYSRPAGYDRLDIRPKCLF